VAEQRKRRVRVKNTKRVDVTSRAITLGKNRRGDTSRQREDADEFISATDIIVETPYQMAGLSQVFEKSNILRQCVSAMETNIARYGYRIVAVKEGQEMDKDEVEILQSFIDYANPDESLSMVHSKFVNDYEKYGFGFREIMRNRFGKVTLVRHAKSYTIRLLKKGQDTVEVTRKISRNGKQVSVKERKKFRRYVQILGGTKTYFKEFGDPRVMDYRTGRFDSDDHPVEKGNEATELLHTGQYSEDVYGIPRWISQLPSILGSRESEEVNLRYFEDNTVPPMMLSVAGGRLTRQSFTDLQNLLNGQGVGKERQNQILLVEAIPESTGLDDKGTVSLKVDKLADVRQGDGLFREYDEANMGKVRSSFRLPPVVIGMSQDITFATANVSAFLAETQVFLPERKMHDNHFNKSFVNSEKGLNLSTVRLESKAPSITNPEQVIKSLTALNVMGGVTPRTAIDTANEALELSIPQYPDKGTEGWMPWMDEPVAFALRGAKLGENTQDEQGDKTEDIKDEEEDGDTLPKPPEKGQE